MTALINIKSLVQLVWVVINTLLALAIGRELGWGENLHQPMPVPMVHSSAPIEVALYPDFRLPAREKTYAVTLERPLFVPSRSVAPPAPPPPPPPPPSMQKGQFQLLGTIITDEMRYAVVKEIASGKERQVVQGYTINSLQLELVEVDRIVFTQYDDREEIRLKIQRSSKPVAAPQGGQSAISQTAPAIQARPIRPAGWAGGKGASSVQLESPAPMPSASLPQTMEDRKRDPMLKDFFK
jgi:hypothetical protein